MSGFLSQLAPTLATALLGPLGGMAVEAIGGALGMTDATQDKIKDVFESGKMTAEQIAAVKTAEFAFKTRMEELQIRPEEIASADRDSARKMQASTKST